MTSKVRNGVAVVVGVVIAVGLVSVGDAAVGRVFPLPAGTNTADSASLRAAVAAMPTAAMIMLLAGWAVATVAGAFVAARVSRQVRQGIIVTGLLVAGTVSNLLMLPHPVWMWPAALLLIPAVGWAAARAAVPGAAA